MYVNEARSPMWNWVLVRVGRWRTLTGEVAKTNCINFYITVVLLNISCIILISNLVSGLNNY